MSDHGSHFYDEEKYSTTFLTSGTMQPSLRLLRAPDRILDGDGLPCEAEPLHASDIVRNPRGALMLLAGDLLGLCQSVIRGTDLLRDDLVRLRILYSDVRVGGLRVLLPGNPRGGALVNVDPVAFPLTVHRHVS